MIHGIDDPGRAIFSDRHHELRKCVGAFFRDEIAPDYSHWSVDGRPPERFWRRAAEIGILGPGLPAEYGGVDGSDFRDSVVVTEEIQRLGMAIGGLRVHTDICTPYLLHHGTEEQKRTWLPRMARGEVIAALGLSEPGAGSDLKSIRTRAVRDGDFFVVNGAKTFISNGSIAGLVILAVKTDPTAGRNGISLLLVDPRSPGFTTGRKLDKLGLHAQDLVELSFTDMRVPVANTLGPIGGGFPLLTSNLAAERLSIAVNSQAAAASAVRWTVEMLAGTRPLQHVKFAVAESAVEVAAGQALVDSAISRLVAGTLSPAEAAAVKLFATELQGRVLTRCLDAQPPGTGFRGSNLVGQGYLDARVSRIYGGSSEIMKVIVGQALGL